MRKSILILSAAFLLCGTLLTAGCASGSAAGETTVAPQTSAPQTTDPQTSPPETEPPVTTEAPITAESGLEKDAPGYYNLSGGNGYAIATEDTHIQYNIPTPLDGAATGLMIKTTYGNLDRAIFLRFSLEGLAEAAAQSKSISIELYVTQLMANAKKSILLSAHEFTGEWSASSLIWRDVSSSKVFMNQTPFAACEITAENLNTKVRLDITSFVMDKLKSGATDFTVVLNDTGKNNMVYYFSSLETAEEGNKPKLVFSSDYAENSGAFSAFVDEIEYASGKLMVTVKYPPDYRGSSAEILARFYDRTGKAVGENGTALLLSENGDAGVTTALACDASLAGAGGYYELYFSSGDVKNLLLAKSNLPEDLNAKFTGYLKELDTPADFVETGVTKDDYLDIIAKCVSVYTVQQMEAMNAVSDIQAYSRVVSSLAALYSANRNPEYDELFINMMNRACAAVNSSSVRGSQKMDFAVRELMLAYTFALDRAPQDRVDYWTEQLSRIVPSTYYKYQTSLNNINIYNMSGEAMRDYYGMVNAAPRFEGQWPGQYTHFNAEGMYLDKFGSNYYRNPILYDLTTRVQLSMVPGFGYSGTCLDTVNSVLRRGGIATLFYQTSTYELAFGGRSNQFLFNDTLIASCGEFEANHYKAAGDLATAGAFKRAAHLAVQNLDRWLDYGKHVKNFYTDNTVGCEDYAYFDKYMMTCSSFLAIGYYFADDTIAEAPCPAQTGGYVYEMGQNFQSIIASCAGYTLQIQENADFADDSSGLGRLVKNGVPSELGLSTPFTNQAAYSVAAGGGTALLSIDAGWEQPDGEVRYISEFTDYSVFFNVTKESRDSVAFTVEYRSPSMRGISAVREEYVLDRDGLRISVKLLDAVKDKVYFRVPLLASNGDNAGALQPELAVTSSSAVLTAGDNSYTVKTDGSVTVGDGTVCNRNGEYKVAYIEKSGSALSVSLALN